MKTKGVRSSRTREGDAGLDSRRQENPPRRPMVGFKLVHGVGVENSRVFRFTSG